MASDFAVGVGNAVVYGGLFADELIWGGSFVRRDEIDRRMVEPANDVVADEPYTTLQVVAATSKELQQDMLEGAFPRLGSDPENSSELAQTSLFSGYSRLYLADLFCTLAFNNTGPEYPSSEVYTMTVEDFTRAINASRASSQVRTAARIGRARAHLQLGNTTEAAADARQVPEGFVYAVEYSGNSARETNTVWTYTLGNRRLVVDPQYWNQTTLDGTDVVDPRVRVTNTGLFSFSGAFSLWAPLDHGSRSSPVKIASWQEAQFIIAEAEGGETAIAILNGLRRRNGIDLLLDRSDFDSEEEVLRKVAEERARTLLLQGHRMADSRRFLDQYSIDLFPKGSRYGDQTCMPLPDKERANNPGLSG